MRPRTSEKKFQEAARGYRKVEKDGQTMYCKKEKPIDSTIPRMQCITETQLRRRSNRWTIFATVCATVGRCTHGPGCSCGRLIVFIPA